jgi:hypothetical protein
MAETGKTLLPFLLIYKKTTQKPLTRASKTYKRYALPLAMKKKTTCRFQRKQKK